MTAIDPNAIEPVLMRASEMEQLGSAGFTMRLLADGGDTGGALSAIRAKMAKGTAGATPHLHRRSSEIFFVLEGGLDVLVGEQIVTAREGDFLLVPPGLAHAFRTPADIGVDMLFVMPGADRFEYFRLLDRIQRGLADRQELLDTQERFDNHFLSSPVWEGSAAR
ncbi:cupin domain-containing protein [Kitasatospora sp. NBC_01266]|uniref:cupin domain-containing protein n=1 Tax=Kitasatospora sp. NBC_01266 TaxID=2903572 RepID=UPI002E315B28|nr:cupin domain-containing protein [Kitasatospora sp. NBC_01266]